MIHNIILIGENENIVFQTSSISAKVWVFLVYLREICAIESSFCARLWDNCVKTINKVWDGGLDKLQKAV